MIFKEDAFTFMNAAKKQLVGIIHSPEKMATNIGLLIVVGGPQYRIGSHRQYIHMARYCAKRGIPVMRFDYQGIGDSDGQFPGFENVSSDIHYAIDEFLKREKTIKTIALWGACEGASSLLLGGTDHKSVSHIILVNPWVRSEAGQAKAYIKHYYLHRLKEADFWRKIFSGKFKAQSALSHLVSNIKKSLSSPKTPSRPSDLASASPKGSQPLFPERMLTSLQNFQGKALLLQSEHDFVAREFDDLIVKDRKWRAAIAEKISCRIDIAETDHTFSTEKWRIKAAENTAHWLLEKTTSKDKSSSNIEGNSKEIPQ